MPSPRFVVRLTQREFSDTVAHLKLSRRKLEIARRALVDQSTLSDLVKDYGKTPDEINEIVQQVYDEWNRRSTSSRVPIEVFEQAIAGLPNVSRQSVEIARRALVQGEPASALAEEFGLTRQRINQIIRRIHADCAQATVVSRMTEKQFADAVSGRGFSEQSLEIAHAVLVIGKPIPEVTMATGLTRQRIRQLVSAVHDAFLAREKIPPGWVTESVTAPKDMLKAFRAAVEEKRKAHFND
ncbi:parR [Burkholderia gladioli]|uniref:ParR n=1 Tax=Burkholderia gladioli TaxID=28095 RepID=A0A2A7S9V6_BURGA|nr:TrfB-related DNA-binding protein [Burkholderia gladioli]PEH40484.1 parR [Burkholderia gladioli]